MQSLEIEENSHDKHGFRQDFQDAVGHYIGSFKNALHFQIDNEYILQGYRINYNTPCLIIKSLFHKHNELLNVWTHLLGAIFTILLIIYLSFYLTDLQGLQSKISQDLNYIFTPVLDHFSQLGSQLSMQEYQHKFSNVLSAVDKLQEQPTIGTSDYSSLVDQMKAAKTLLNSQYDDQSVFQKYSQELTAKFLSIKQKIIQEIDSQQFDWIEIYKQNYTSLIDENKLSPLSQNYSIRSTSDPNHVSRWPIFVFLVSAIACLGGSALFHLFYQMSEVANKYLMRVDYAGSVFPPLYYGFYCDQFWQYLYMSLNALCCTSVYVISIFDFIHTEKWRRVKGIMYGSLGLFAGAPCIHLYYRQVSAGQPSDCLPFAASLPKYLAMGASYLGGLALYILRVPERFKPGVFDIIGHSHQIWHCCVIMGVVFSYLAALDNLYDRKQTFCLIN